MCRNRVGRSGRCGHGRVKLPWQLLGARSISRLSCLCLRNIHFIIFTRRHNLNRVSEPILNHRALPIVSHPISIPSNTCERTHHGRVWSHCIPAQLRPILTKNIQTECRRAARAKLANGEETNEGIHDGTGAPSSLQQDLPFRDKQAETYHRCTRD